MAEQAWLESGWQAIPAVREDLRGHNDFVFNLQWTGTADKITTTLETADWHSASIKLRDYFNWFNPSATITELPLLPHVHDGQYEEFRFTRIIPPDKLFVIRLWRSQIEIQSRQDKQPLWFGYISEVEKVEHFGLRYLATIPDFITPLQWFQSQPPGASAIQRTLKIKSTSDKDLKRRVLFLETN